MATLVCSPNKLNLEPKRSRLSLKNTELHDNETSDFLSIKNELSEDSVCQGKDSMQAENSDAEKYILTLGLPNCGNTCYLNTIIQVLRFTPNFMQQVHRVLSSRKQFEKVFSSHDEYGTFFYRLHMLYMTMKKQEAFLKREDGIDMSSFLLQNIKTFLLSLRNISFSFEEDEQHDAHELLLTILSAFKAFHDAVKETISEYLKILESPESPKASDIQISVHNTSGVAADKEQRMKRKRKMQKNLGKSYLFALDDGNASDLGFQGAMRHTIICLECETHNIKTEMFTNVDISIQDDHIIEGTINLRECLEQKTILNGENKYFCEQCYQKNEAISRYDVIVPPSILLLHCSWLRQSSNITDVEKDTTKVLIPLVLKTSENPKIFSCKAEETYSLYAIILHIGLTAEGGHYVAFIKDASKTPEMAMILGTCQNYCATNCCTTEEMMNYKLFTSVVNNWLLFDDDEVSPVSVEDGLEIFPYFEYLGMTASPCLIFYFKT